MRTSLFCVFKHVANLINWVVSGIADDIADCFLIFKNNPIELPRACFAYLYPGDGHLSFNVETSMGMGMSLLQMSRSASTIQ